MNEPTKVCVKSPKQFSNIISFVPLFIGIILICFNILYLHHQDKIPFKQVNKSSRVQINQKSNQELKPKLDIWYLDLDILAAGDIIKNGKKSLLRLPPLNSPIFSNDITKDALKFVDGQSKRVKFYNGYITLIVIEQNGKTPAENVELVMSKADNEGLSTKYQQTIKIGSIDTGQQILIPIGLFISFNSDIWEDSNFYSVGFNPINISYYDALAKKRKEISLQDYGPNDETTPSIIAILKM